jgi:hypothetical protein
MAIFTAYGMAPAAQATVRTNPFDEVGTPNNKSTEKKVHTAYEKNILVVTVLNKQAVDNSGKPLAFAAPARFNMDIKEQREKAAKHCIEQNTVACGRSTTGLDRDAAIAKVMADGETNETAAAATVDKDAAVSKKIVKDLCLADKKRKYASWNDNLVLSAVILAPLAPIIGLIKLIFDQVIEHKATKASEKLWKKLNRNTLDNNYKVKQNQIAAKKRDEEFSAWLATIKSLNQMEKELTAFIEAQEAQAKAKKEEAGTKIQDELISLTSQSVELQVRATILDEELKEIKDSSKKEKIQTNLDKVIKEAEDINRHIKELERQLSQLGDNDIFSKVIDNVEIHCKALQSEAKQRIEIARESREAFRKEKAESKKARHREAEKHLEDEKKALEARLQAGLDAKVAFEKRTAALGQGRLAVRAPAPFPAGTTVVADPKAAAEATFANLI